MNKENIESIYNKLYNINLNINKLDISIKELEKELTKTFKINDNIIESRNITSSLNKIALLKKSINNEINYIKR